MKEKYSVEEYVNKNEIEAESLLRKNKISAARKVLNRNLKVGTDRTHTFDLLLEVNRRMNNFPGILEVLDSAMKYSNKKEKYRKLRKDIIISKILSDIEDVEDNS